MFKTADLYDGHAAEVRVVEPGFRHYGGRTRFCGLICTINVYEDNLLVHEQVEGAG